MEINHKNIGERIRSVRLDKNLNQEVFAKTLDVNRHSLSRIETGKQPVPLQMLVSIWEAFGVNSDYVFNVQETEKISGQKL